MRNPFFLLVELGLGVRLGGEERQTLAVGLDCKTGDVRAKANDLAGLTAFGVNLVERTMLVLASLCEEQNRVAVASPGWVGDVHLAGDEWPGLHVRADDVKLGEGGAILVDAWFPGKRSGGKRPSIHRGEIEAVVTVLSLAIC